MATLSLLDVFDRPSILGPEPGESRDADHPEVGAVGGVPTLDDLLTGTWDELLTGATVACPICTGPMEPRYSAGHAPVGGRCRHCETELS